MQVQIGCQCGEMPDISPQREPELFIHQGETVDAGVQHTDFPWCIKLQIKCNPVNAFEHTTMCYYCNFACASALAVCGKFKQLSGPATPVHQQTAKGIAILPSHSMNFHPNPKILV